MPNRADYTDVREFNKLLTEEFRANAGKVTGDFADRPLLILTTTGARSGQVHTTPLVYANDDGRMYVVAAAGGAPKHPAWYLNLVVRPSVTVELPGESFPANAVVAAGAERARLVAARLAESSAFAAYQEKAGREIPFVFLDRTD